MDPKATLELARSAWKGHDLVACIKHLHDYSTWKVNGGFSDPEDDREVANLIERIARIEMEREARFVLSLDDDFDNEEGF